ncbi:protein-tyrosine phosphatase-like protein, partial [Baffinella frigidus]
MVSANMQPTSPTKAWPERNSQGVYKVSKGLYISGIEGAQEVVTLQQQGITHILNMVGPALYEHPLAGGREKSFFPHLFTYKMIVARDAPDQDLAQFFEETSRFIHQGRMAGGVLVHCYAGVSRSATAILAYLIDSFGLDAGTSFEFIRRARPQ